MNAPASARLAALAALCAAVTLTGCSTGSSPTAGSPPVPVTSQTDSPPATSLTTDAAPSTTVSTTSSTAPTATRTKPKPTRAAPGVPACAMAQLSVRVLRGSAALGTEYAAINFTNSSAAACTLFGYPGVSLRERANQLGQPAQRSGKAARTMTLAPGDTVQSQLRDHSSCQAQLSDTVRVYPPNETGFVDRPLQLRGCALEVDPVATPQ